MEELFPASKVLDVNWTSMPYLVTEVTMTVLATTPCNPILWNTYLSNNDDITNNINLQNKHHLVF